MVNGVLLTIDNTSSFGWALGDASQAQAHLCGIRLKPRRQSLIALRVAAIVIVSACDTARDSPVRGGFIHFRLVSELQLVATQGPHDLQASRSVHTVATVRRISASRQTNGRRHAQGQARVTCRAEVPSKRTCLWPPALFCLIALMSSVQCPLV
ncbi:hypothetical protein K458DRAFT_77278 [Lentithecium fluviatile CBS 122367]|uniref:Uncharacterized protein n=1 Tax=Lentithecium fluviatile CBS 122367 TaxID=1168545 RepID=A0A6G1IUV0_9PLEO|nr:hypothetical protein K458DRAFT_77278 [Lentithecium fluviatile CBS 122367]